ncbi:hypothetical protein BFP72_10650 [Reichenbachiella sp. 5M10]|nr:hypothetical protein BFP72_10650 [Reichenbachiella sp. 5M10]
MEEDPNSLDPSEIFIKYFGTTDTEGVVDLVQTSSDEFLLLGFTNNTTANDYDFYLIKTDSAGNGIWQQTYGYDDGVVGNAESQDVPTSIHLFNNDQNAMAIGTSDISDTLRIFMVNIDLSTGEAVDTFSYQFYDDRSATAIDDQGYKSTLGADVVFDEVNNQFIVLGSVETWSSDVYLTDPQSIFLMSLDASLDWHASDFEPTWIDITGLRLEDTGVKLVQDEGEYFYVATVTIPVGSGVGYGNRDVFISEFNPLSGTPGVNNYYGTSVPDVAASVIAYGNDLLITGTSGNEQNDQAFFLNVPKSLPKTVAGGFVIDVVEDMGIIAEGSQGKDLVRLSNGDITIAGQLNSYTAPGSDREFKENEIVLFRVDGFGNLDTDNFRVYGSEDNDQANAIILREDGALVIGATVDFGSTSMMSLLKTNSRGEFK